MIAAKSALRQKLRQSRLDLAPAEQREAAQAVAALGLQAVQALTHAHPRLAGPPAQTPVALYASLPGELDALPFLHRLAAAGYPTLLPVTQGKAKLLRFHLWRPGEALIPGPYGLKHPRLEAPEISPRLIFAPLLGFDGQGGRLGYGGGYYDATLAQLRRASPVLAGGLAFACQKIDILPLEPHDQKLDFVLTEAGLTDF